MSIPGPVQTCRGKALSPNTHTLLHIYRLIKGSWEISSFRKYQEIYQKILIGEITGKVKKYCVSFPKVWEYVWKVDIKIIFVVNIL